MKEPSVLRPAFDWTPHRLSVSPELDASLLAGHLPDVNLLPRSGWLAAREPSRGGVARELLALAAAMFPLDFARVTALSEDGRRRGLAEWSGMEGRDAAPLKRWNSTTATVRRPW
ncbi:MAG: hypothetical protein K8I02_08905, partial [Candidatus Methylomirabilis sp.]|nr:hypothetical protein [Deltaproteobacteria bacterium]